MADVVDFFVSEDDDLTILQKKGERKCTVGGGSFLGIMKPWLAQNDRIAQACTKTKQTNHYGSSKWSDWTTSRNERLGFTTFLCLRLVQSLNLVGNLLVTEFLGAQAGVTDNEFHASRQSWEQTIIPLFCANYGMYGPACFLEIGEKSYANRVQYISSSWLRGVSHFSTMQQSAMYCWTCGFSYVPTMFKAQCTAAFVDFSHAPIML